MHAVSVVQQLNFSLLCQFSHIFSTTSQVSFSQNYLDSPKDLSLISIHQQQLIGASSEIMGQKTPLLGLTSRSNMYIPFQGMESDLFKEDIEVLDDQLQGDVRQIHCTHVLIEDTFHAKNWKSRENLRSVFCLFILGE